MSIRTLPIRPSGSRNTNSPVSSASDGSSWSAWVSARRLGLSAWITGAYARGHCSRSHAFSATLCLVSRPTNAAPCSASIRPTVSASSGCWDAAPTAVSHFRLSRDSRTISARPDPQVAIWWFSSRNTFLRWLRLRP